MYKLKVDLWKNNKYGNPDETHYAGEYITTDAAQIDSAELHKRLVFSCGYKRIRIEIIKKDEKNERIVDVNE